MHVLVPGNSEKLMFTASVLLGWLGPLAISQVGTDVLE